MQQRSANPPDEFDYFPTPAWASRAFVEHMVRRGRMKASESVWEPACGEGHMAKPLAEFFDTVVSSDVFGYGAGEVHDFLSEAPLFIDRADWIITNPPFLMAGQFITRALEIASKGVAMLVRTSFLEGIERYHLIFGVTPPTFVLQYVERVPMVRGRLDREVSSATSYCWVVWYREGPHWRWRWPDGTAPTTLEWIAPSKWLFDRDGDWPEPDQARVEDDRGSLFGGSG